MKSVGRQHLTHLQVQLVSVKASAVLASLVVAPVMLAVKLCYLAEARSAAGQVNENSIAAAYPKVTSVVPVLAVIVRVELLAVI